MQQFVINCSLEGAKTYFKTSNQHCKDAPAGKGQDLLVKQKKTA